MALQWHCEISTQTNRQFVRVSEHVCPFLACALSHLSRATLCWDINFAMWIITASAPSEQDSSWMLNSPQSACEHVMSLHELLDSLNRLPSQKGYLTVCWAPFLYYLAFCVNLILLTEIHNVIANLFSVVLSSSLRETQYIPEAVAPMGITSSRVLSVNGFLWQSKLSYLE